MKEAGSEILAAISYILYIYIFCVLEMGWGNIYRRRAKVFTLAMIIYIDYKVRISRIENLIMSYLFRVMLIAYADCGGCLFLY